MNSKQARRLRKRAREATQHLPEAYYRGAATKRLGECQRGAYKALKAGNVRIVEGN